MLRQQEGLSLMEMVIGLAVLSIVLTSLMVALSAGTLATGVVNKRGTAQDMARSQMESVKNAPYASAPTSYPTITPSQGYTVTNVAMPLGGSDQGIQWVTVTVYFAGNPIFTLEDYKGNR
ncbi:MAG: hypothetical protein Q7R39_19560 [Dehalococcoidia bacterium]|nr:hypothetical protein [Dehalococcoidia bacterium]